MLELNPHAVNVVTIDTQRGCRIALVDTGLHDRLPHQTHGASEAEGIQIARQA